MLPGPPYAWPSPDEADENKARVITQVLTDSFNQSCTKIKDKEAILSAARHIAQLDRLVLTFRDSIDNIFDVADSVCDLVDSRCVPYAYPSDNVADENKAATIVQILANSFNQSHTKIKDAKAVLSAARHIAQSHDLTITLKT